MTLAARIFALATDAITVEGALIAPVLLARVAAQQAESQSNADYKIPKGLTLRDEIARNFRIGQALFAELNASPVPSTIKTIGFVEALFRDVFGFSDMARVGTRTVNDRLFAVTLEGLSGRVPVVVVPPSDPLDRASDHLPTEGRRRSAASAVQDWLNAREDALWGFCCNGDRLRLLRDNASLTRPAYIEADLRQIFEADAFADFTLLWLLIHASRFGLPDSTAADCILERWREAGSRVGAVARDRLRDGVEAALRVLGTGFLAGNFELRRRVEINALSLDDFFGQLLRLVYRLIFLLVAEDRGLLHDPGSSQETRSFYLRGYSVSSLRDRAVRRTAWDSHHDKWEGLAVVFSALARGEELLGLPALGGLFAPEMMPDLESARLTNRALMEAIFRLAWLREDSGLVPVNWRDMETEELGSVYESLLELTPRLIDESRGFAFAEGGEAKGHARKTTGSYYTPDSLVQALLNSALDPVLDRIEAEADDPAEALLAVTVIDPACGSGHFLLAAGRRIATRLARARASGVACAEDFRHALRDVARTCLYAVDRNPMAVELTKVALWIETVEPGKPLGFLDANIRCGDALLGVFDIDVLRVGIPDAAYRPLTGDDKTAARSYAARNRDEQRGQGNLDFVRGGGRFPATPLSKAWSSVRALQEDSAEQIAEKRRLFESVRTDRLNYAWGEAADLYIAAFLLPKSEASPGSDEVGMVPTTSDVWCALADRQAHPPLVARATEASRRARALHWPLEFPDVMAKGGFDIVLGNPPWERIKLQEQEFFASLDVEIATAPNAAARSRLIAALARAELGTRERALHESFEIAKRLAEASSIFARESGRFPLTGRGDVNTYALFAELFANLVSPRGRAGLIVPTGIATDSTTAAFFAALVEGRRLARLVDFENRERIFAAVYFRVKFCLLTMGHGIAEAQFCFFLTNPTQIGESERQVTLSSEQIARINPNTKTAPVFRARADAELTAKIYRHVPVLINEAHGADGNPWGVSFISLFHMSNDSGLFRSGAQLREEGFVQERTDWTRGTLRYVPLYEAKMAHQFHHRYGDFLNAADKGTTDYREIPQADMTKLADPDYEPTPRYWVPESEVAERLAGRGWSKRWLIGWRDITNATNERTLIATSFPRMGVANNLPVMLFGAEIDARYIAALQGCLSSLVCDFVTRHKVGGTHLNNFIYQQLPILPPAAYSERDLAFVVPRVLELTYTSHAMAPFARDLGYVGAPFVWNEERRAHLRAELDAFYARAYGLTRDEFRYVIDPEDVKGAGYPSETFRVLKASEVRRFGEYRTGRLVLDAWDRIESGEISGEALAVANSAVRSATASGVTIAGGVLPDDSWARPDQPQPGDIGAVLTALLKALDSPKPIRTVRLAAALVLEPRLLVPLLPEPQASEWRRLVGSEAELLPSNVAPFASRVNAAWGAVVRNHRGNGRLIEDLGSNTWACGSGLEAIDTRGWPEGRAGFVLNALKNINLDTAAPSLPVEIQQWIMNAAAA